MDKYDKGHTMRPRNSKPLTHEQIYPVTAYASVHRRLDETVDRSRRRFRPFRVHREIGYVTIEARSSLEAGAIFLRSYNGQLMHEIEDSIDYERTERNERHANRR